MNQWKSPTWRSIKSGTALKKIRSNKFPKAPPNTSSKKNKTEKVTYLKSILKRMKTLLDNEQLKQLCLDVSKLIDSDGIVMTSEIEIADLIKSELGLSIKLNKDL